MKKNLSLVGWVLLGFSFMVRGNSLSPAAVDVPEENSFPSLTRDPFQWPAAFKEVIRQKQIQRNIPVSGAQPMQTAPIQPPSLQLQGVLWGSSRPQAIINRKIVSVGDVIEEAKIVDIGKNSIKISYREQEFEIKLLQRESDTQRRGL